MRTVLCFLMVVLFSVSFGQNNEADSIRQLQPILIQAYATDRPLIDVAASLGYIDQESLNRFNNTNLLPALNVVPGVRMEERSPGSYRFSIRGSLLRSPFGVRNVKVYWNGLPLTDGGGNTYLNLVDFNSVGTIEIIKGPGGSLYGAGTGGVLLLNSSLIDRDQVQVSTVFGGYGLQRYDVGAQVHSQKVNARIQYAHQQSNGYRVQTAMKRDAINADLVFQLNANSALSATLFYSDLFYETPGGLTKAQYDADPKQARPRGGPNRGAVEQQASVYNKTPYLGVTYEHDWDDRWSTRVGLFGSHTNFTNPTIRNYERRDESNIGGRAETQYKFNYHQRKSKVTLGGEYQYFKSPITVNWNEAGTIDTLQTKDKLTSRLMLLFAQAEMHLPANFFLTIGGSVNFLQFDFNREYPTLVSEERTLDPSFSPRIALLNKITPGLSVYGSISRGFSPPSIAELYPSRQIFDKNIQAEQGKNYEIGLKGTALHKALSFEITGYIFQLKNTLVIRRDTTLFGDPEYFVNAGKTSQRGIEAMVSWEPIRNGTAFISGFRIWSSYAFNRYRFDEYMQNTNDFSGNKLTGMPPVVNSSGLDLMISRKIYLNTTAVYVDHTPLNDANTIFAKEYFLFGSRVGFRTTLQHHMLDIFAGVDNALDRKYSLGNDLNAAGGRYFNAAAPRNFYAGLRFSWLH